MFLAYNAEEHEDSSGLYVTLLPPSTPSYSKLKFGGEVES